MKRLFTGPAFALALSASAFVAGCGEATTEEPAAPTAPAAPAEPAAADGAAADDAEDPLASLSPAAREAVLAQKICPVTEEALGSMGPPIPVTIDDKVYYVCCDACVDSLKSEPEQYLANLTAAQANAADEAPAADTPAQEAGG